MIAAVLKGPSTWGLESVEIPKVKPGSVLLKVRACGICGSDIRIMEQGNPRVKYPAILGHEIAGDIAEVGSGVTQFKPGDRVAVGADVPCGECDWCRMGKPNYCEINWAMGYQWPGAFAEYCLLEPLVVNAGPIVKIPETLSYDEAAIAEPLGCCLNGMERVGMSAGKSVLIIGAGPVGLMLLCLAKTLKAKTTLVSDTNPQRLPKAKELGADRILDSGTNDLSASVKEWSGGKGADVIFIACPSPDAQEQAVTVVAKGGVINCFGGLPAQARKIQLSSNILHYKEASLTGSHGSTPRQHAQALAWLAKGDIPGKALISHRIPLKDMKDALDIVKKQSGLKVVVTMDKKGSA